MNCFHYRSRHASLGLREVLRRSDGMVLKRGLVDVKAIDCSLFSVICSLSPNLDEPHPGKLTRRSVFQEIARIT
jgi:hypothetical protein